MLRAYGAEVVVCPTAVAPEDPDSYYSVSDRLVREIAGRLEAQPVRQPEQPGQPLRDDRPGDLGATPTAGSPTSSPASAPAAPSPAPAATSRRSSGGRVQVIGADPEGSVYSGGTGRPYLVEGVGEDFWPDGLRPRRSPTRSSRSPTRDSFAMTRRLAREEGLLVGGSCGMAVVAALRVAERPDRGRRGRGAPARRRPRLPVQDLQRRAGWRPTGSWRSDGEAHRRRRAARQERRAAGAGAHPPERDRARRGRDPARVRRLADAGGLRRAAGDGRRGGRRRCPSASCWTRCSPAGPRWPTRSTSTWRRRCRWSAPARTSRRARHALQDGERYGGRRRQAGRRADPAPTCSAFLAGVTSRNPW